MWYASLWPYNKTQFTLRVGVLELWVYAIQTLHSSYNFFFFQGKSLEKNESDSAHVVWNLKILLVKFPCGCNEVINEILFEVFFYYIQHAEKLIKNWV